MIISKIKVIERYTNYFALEVEVICTLNNDITILLFRLIKNKQNKFEINSVIPTVAILIVPPKAVIDQLINDNILEKINETTFALTAKGELYLI